MLHRMRTQAKGFTLLELLIVVAIIGVLAAIAIPNFVSASTKSKYGRTLADTKTIVSQVMLYQNDNNAYPANWAALQGGNYMSTTSDPFAAANTPYLGTITAAPVNAFTTGKDANGAWAAPAAAIWKVSKAPRSPFKSSPRLKSK